MSRALLELYPNPSVFSILSLVAFSISLLFHVIAFCTNHWCYFVLDGRHINLGIWEGCWKTSPGESLMCSDEIFDDEIFQGNDWHIGVRILMLISLLSLFLQEFALIAYACLKQCNSLRPRLTGAILGFTVVLDGFLLASAMIFRTKCYQELMPNGCQLAWSFVVAILSFVLQVLAIAFVIVDFYTALVLTLLITRHNASKHPEDQVGWSYAMEILCLIFSVVMTTTFCLDRNGITCTSLTKTSENLLQRLKSTGAEQKDNSLSKHMEKEEKHVDELPVPVHDSISYRSGSYAYVSDSNLSDITVSTDVVSYSKEPGRFRLDTLEWDV